MCFSTDLYLSSCPKLPVQISTWHKHREIMLVLRCGSWAVQIVEGETRLKQQQNLYEAVRADRNLYSKNLIQAQDEIQEMKRKFQIMVCCYDCGQHMAHTDSSTTVDATKLFLLVANYNVVCEHLKTSL